MFECISWTIKHLAAPGYLPLCPKVRKTMAYMGHKTHEEYRRLECDASNMAVT